jgi:hypothetical protein
MSIGHILLQTGLSPSEFWHSAEVFAEGLRMVRALYGFDGILISLHGHSPDWERRILRLERSKEGETVHWKGGEKTFFPFDDLPVPLRGRTRKKADFASFNPDSLPETLQYIPVSQGLRFDLEPRCLFDIFESFRGAEEEYSIHGEVTSPLDYFLDLFGFEQAMVALIEDPGKSLEILERLTSGITTLAVGQAEKGVDAVKLSSPFSGAGFISPEHYKRFVLPFESRICKAVQKKGAHVYLHVCGDIHDRLELMAGSGASGIECLDPPPLGRVDLGDAKKRLGGRIFIKGNIDPVNTLLQGSPDRVREDAHRRLLVGMPGGGYILSSACSIAPRTPRENVQILHQAVAEFGRYPKPSVS